MRRRSVELQGDMGTVQTQLLACKRELERLRKDKEKLSKDNSEYQTEIQIVRKENIQSAEEIQNITEQLTELTEKFQVGAT